LRSIHAALATNKFVFRPVACRFWTRLIFGPARRGLVSSSKASVGLGYGPIRANEHHLGTEKQYCSSLLHSSFSQSPRLQSPLGKKLLGACLEGKKRSKFVGSFRWAEKPCQHASMPTKAATRTPTKDMEGRIIIIFSVQVRVVY
jgi:hypothetical protein